MSWQTALTRTPPRARSALSIYIHVPPAKRVLQQDISLEHDSALDVSARHVGRSSEFCTPRAEHGGGFPVSASSPESAEMPKQETAALMLQRRETGARFDTFQAAAAEQLSVQTATIASLQTEVSALQRCVMARDAELEQVYEKLRVAQRALDQSIRTSTSDSNVRTPYIPVRTFPLTMFHRTSAFASKPRSCLNPVHKLLSLTLPS